jgi:hypothetical protein
MSVHGIAILCWEQPTFITSTVALVSVPSERVKGNFGQLYRPALVGCFRGIDLVAPDRAPDFERTPFEVYILVPQR